MSTSNKLFQAASGNAGEAVYVDDLYAIHLYRGNQTAHTITTGVDLSGTGGLLWIKAWEGSGSTSEHVWLDTARGVNKYIRSNSSVAEATGSFTQTFTSTGFTLNTSSALVNDGGTYYTSYSFLKQEKFFDVVTYTGTGGATTVSHNLGSVPGMILVKRTDSTKDWWAYHVGANGGTNPATKYIVFNENDAEVDSDTAWNDTAPTATQFSLGTSTNVNASGASYVAYLFANGETDFGENSDEAIIKCGHFSSDSSGEATVSLGFEPQWMMFKRRDSATNGDWYVMDYVRGLGTYDRDGKYVSANRSNAQANIGVGIDTDGINGWSFTASANYIYVAIARPQKVPEAGTEVFDTVLYTGNNATTNRNIDTGKNWATDLHLHWNRTYGTFGAGASTNSGPILDRMRGMYNSLSAAGPHFAGNNAGAEFSNVSGISFNTQADFEVNYTAGNMNQNSVDMLAWMFRRAPKFFEIVGYVGNGTNPRTIAHNLKVAPELLIVKNRQDAENFTIWNKTIAASDAANYIAWNSDLIATNAAPTRFNSTAPTASVFTVASDGAVNKLNNKYIAYMWATLDGISKVGTYTGNGSTQNIDCGFSSGARWIMIKRVDSNSGHWLIMDSERGIVAGDDPIAEFSSANAEDTTTDIVDPYSAGFSLTSETKGNQSGTKYIFLAIA